MPADGLLAGPRRRAGADRLRVPALRRDRVPAPGLVRARARRATSASAGSAAAGRCGPGRSSASRRSRRRTPATATRSSPTASATWSCPASCASRRGSPRPTRRDCASACRWSWCRGDGNVAFAFRPAEDGVSVAVVGLGIHPFGRHDGVSGLEMAAVAARAALRDAGVGWGDIDFAAGGSDAAGNADTIGLGARPHRRAVRQRAQRLRDRRVGAGHGARHARGGRGRARAGRRLRQAPAGRVQPAARGLGPRRVVRRDRPDADHAVLRHEDPALHGRARRSARRRSPRWRRRRSPTAPATRTRGGGGRSPRTRCSARGWSTTR